MAELIAIAKLRRDGGTQPRAMLDPSTVEAYADGVREGAKFPPVILFYDGTNHWLADGFHRAAGHEAAGCETIPAEVRAGTQRDAVLFACGANATHGLRRTTGDKRRAVLMLLGDAEWAKWSDRQIARHARVSNTFVGNLRAVTVNVDSERIFATKHGGVAKMDTAAIGRRHADVATIRSVPIEALAQVVTEDRRRKQLAKKAKRAARVEQLAASIVAANERMAEMVASERRFGLILEDPEWPWESYSPDTGMDRAEENHYPTSSIDEICARPIGDLAARDCVYLIWATPPRLLSAIRVMEARGFTYRTHSVWRKLLPGAMRGRGYWFHFTHELVLLGTKGNPPCPAPGEQWDSVFEAPRGANSVKPPNMHEWAERFFPGVPKLECNARAARPGWDVWGAEAPDHFVDATEMVPAGAPVFVGVDLAASPDLTVEIPVLPLRGRAPQPFPFSASSPGEPTCNS